ncbi:unnamed protein product [Trichobilharzia szidati]|nr:unnamed protein product [Trichobilharzia szidati]
MQTAINTGLLILSAYGTEHDVPNFKRGEESLRLDSSILTSDSSVALRSPSNPEWISQLINCSPYITTPLQAMLLVTMTNGSVIEAYNFLTTGKRRQPSSSDEFSPPLWLFDDDRSLSSEDAEAVDELVNRFGWTEVIERCKFLKDPD